MSGVTMKNLDKGIEILKILNSNSFEAFIVGGAVRDYLLGSDSNDIDITTNATYKDICRIFNNVLNEGEKYLSCRVIYDGIEFEITSFRKDISYTDHRHPVTVLAPTLEEDLKRRDFTINALAMNSKYEIIDLFDGKKDLDNKLIKTIGEANVRFDEDCLRVLRALYFSSKLNFDLDQDILDSFKNNHIKFLKQEYIKNMIFKMFSLNSKKGLEYIVKYDVLRDFPFWQELVRLVLEFNCKNNYFSLYLIKHLGFPKDVILTKKEIITAKKINGLVSNNFNEYNLFNTEIEYLNDAVELYNCLYKTNIDYEEIYNKYLNLKIHSSKEINYDFNWLLPNERSKMINLVIKEILSDKLENNFGSIDSFVRSVYNE